MATASQKMMLHHAAHPLSPSRSRGISISCQAQERHEQGDVHIGGHETDTKGCKKASDLMRFLLVMRGTRMAAPSKLLPVMKIPLYNEGYN